MTASLLTATIATGLNTELDFDLGRKTLSTITDAHLFNFGDADTEMDALLPSNDPDVVYVDDHLFPILEFAVKAGSVIIDRLEKAVDHDNLEVDELAIGGYKVYIAGGMSNGVIPTDSAQAIWDCWKLPYTVLEAIGFIIDISQPASPEVDGAKYTDSKILDAIALGLGTKPEWAGADELTWIADTISHVREHPGDAIPSEYVQRFASTHGIDPLADSFLRGFVSNH